MITGLASHPWIPNSPENIRRKMLETIGVKSVDELFNDIPPEAKISKEDWDNLDIGFKQPVSEIEAKQYTEQLLSKNRVFNPPPFMGGGVYPHYVPPLVKYIVSRGEFLTAYTPYQPEVSQGLMQALFEYQSLIAELYDMDIVNSSMYDWGSALAEALLMALRVNQGRNRVLLARNINPYHKMVVETYLEPHGVEITYVDYDRETGLIDLDDLMNKIDGNTAAVYIQNPNFLGYIEENARDVGEIAHSKNALYIVGSDPIALGLIKPPGELGADIAVGEGQPLGLGMNYGGPYLGIFGVKYDAKLLRQIPGRIIGLASTVDGERAFAMILQAREQHIRRERATSNICTNEALSAIASAVYLTLLGADGLVELSKLIYYRSHYAYEKLRADGFECDLFKADFFQEFPIRFDKHGLKYRDVHEKFLKKNIHGGLYIGEWFPELGESALFAFTELHTARDIDFLVNVLKEIVGGGL